MTNVYEIKLILENDFLIPDTQLLSSLIYIDQLGDNGVGLINSTNSSNNNSSNNNMIINSSNNNSNSNNNIIINNNSAINTPYINSNY